MKGPRQIGRYLVPTPLGIGLIDIMESDEQTALLSQPSIRSGMEEQVAQIARGECDKAEVLKTNLAWFLARHADLAALVRSREKIEAFTESLMPLKGHLRKLQGA